MVQPPVPKSELVKTVATYERSGGNISSTAKALGVSRSTVRRRLDLAAEQGITADTAASRNPRPGETCVYIVTSAQNGTPVRKDFWNNLIRYANFRNAELIVVPYSYSRTMFDPSDPERFNDYDEVVRPYLFFGRRHLARRLILAADTNTIPTAVDPTTGWESMSGTEDLIVPHSKVALRSIATMIDAPAKIIQSTGTVTEPNYRRSRAGARAEWHHTFGACVVEVTPDGHHFVRHLIADSDGGFQDLDVYVSKSGVARGLRVEAIYFGDIHHALLDPEVEECAWGRSPDSLMEVLRPRHQFLGDVFHMYARNGHERNDPLYRARMAEYGTGDVREEVRAAAEWLANVASRDFCRTVVVGSNHDDMLDRWLSDRKVFDDHENAEFWHYLNYYRYRAVGSGETKWSAFAFAARDLVGTQALQNVTFLPYGSSYKICMDTTPIECALHGDKGPNGARGSITNLAKIGEKVCIGHSHSPGIRDGAYQAGVCQLRQGYNENGPSSWAIAHIVVYPNGKRTLLFPDGLRWRG